MARVIVPYARNRIAYAVIQSLSRAGHDVTAADSIPVSMGIVSRYANNRMIYPDPFVREEEFVKWATIRVDDGYKIYPTFMEAWVLRKHRLPTLAPEYEMIMRANNKWEVNKTGSKLGLAVPYSILVPPDSVIKPTNGRGARGVQYTTEDLMIQDKVVGSPVGVACLFNRGKLRAKFTWGRKVEYPSTGGMSLTRMSITSEYHESAAIKLLESLSWHGAAMVEFKGLHLLEINPRMWGSLALAIHSGVDFPKLIVDIMTKGDCEDISDKPYKGGVTMSWLAGCLFARQFPRGYWEEWNLSDPLPFFTQFSTVAYNLIRHRHLALDHHN